LAALLALPAEGDHDTALTARATALEGAAWLSQDVHDFTQASALFAQSGALRRTLGLEERPAAPMVNAALAARDAGNYGHATSLLEECLAQYRRRGNREETIGGDLGLSLSWGYRYTLLALVLREQGEYARASALCEECLALAREREDAEGIGIALLSLADLARDQSEVGRVRMMGEECLVRFRELDHQWGIGFVLNNLALAAYLEGDLELAVHHAEESAAIFRRQQAGSSLAEVLITVGRVRGAQAEADAARASLTEALRLAWADGPRVVVAAVLEEIGVQAVRQGQARHGVYLLAAAARLREVMGAPVRLADRRAIEGALTTAEVTLGAAAYAEAWNAGQTSPLEQIVASAGDDP
jgi:tetratricopeptide (TPR) repeat protein